MRVTRLRQTGGIIAIVLGAGVRLAVAQQADSCAATTLVAEAAYRAAIAAARQLRRAFHGGGSVGGTTTFGMDRDAHVAFALTSNLTDAPLGPASRIAALLVAARNPRGP